MSPRKTLAVLGSTGSIGTQTLDVVGRFPERFEVLALAAGRNTALLIQQAKQVRPKLVSVADPGSIEAVRDGIGDPRVEVVCDPVAVARAGAELVIAAQVGGVGLAPVLAALRAGADVALANKEVLVMGGELVLAEARRAGRALLPIDSEHAAIAQCLQGQDRKGLARIQLTASGGPFRQATRAEMEAATPELALRHPNWDMGPKITIDSATLMNKGFEWIEARWLFDVEPRRIDIVIHPESIVHSLVEFCDGSWLAQLGVPDMRVPIAYTLGLPGRLPLDDVAPLDLVALGALHFEAPDEARFPALGLVRAALAAGGTAPAVLNAANEVAVGAFLSRRIPFTAITEVVDAVLGAEAGPDARDLEAVFAADRRARDAAEKRIGDRYPHA